MNQPWGLTPFKYQTKIKINVRNMVTGQIVNMINSAEVGKRKVKEVGVDINMQTFLILYLGSLRVYKPNEDTI